MTINVNEDSTEYRDALLTLYKNSYEACNKRLFETQTKLDILASHYENADRVVKRLENLLKLKYKSNSIMDHFYDGINGHFDYPEVYTIAVNEAPDTAHFVEIGAYFGQSTAYLGVEIVNSKKNIKLDVIDTWQGNDSSEYQEGNWGHHMTLNNDTYLNFTKNMKPLEGRYTPIQMDSVKAAELYEDRSLDFVFIDGAHDYKYVKADIEAWLPKVKIGGYLAGHDYTHGDHDEVIKAVDEAFGENIKVYHRSWMHKVG